MDRFIARDYPKASRTSLSLKSNMDRFIAIDEMVQGDITLLFKIQYG